MKIETVKAYQHQMELQQLDQHIMELKHQALKINADIIDNERMRVRRLDTGGRSRGVGTKVDTLA
jgi:cell division protein FtsL